ncbi:hypothetical protein DB42_CE00060 [Neochlamydia sp. EPS4]|nr:hypothetical protein DB42_CE00060 [Neochlamydia sp. EPS4]
MDSKSPAFLFIHSLLIGVALEKRLLQDKNFCTNFLMLEIIKTSEEVVYYLFP